MSGSWRRIERRMRGKVRPISSLAWILDREDLPPTVDQLGEAGVEGRRLADAGRPRHEEQTLRAPQHRANLRPGLVVEADLVEAREMLTLLQQPQRDVLAMAGRHGGDADVDLGIAEPRAETAVLGQPPFGDVEIGHDLDARDDRRIVVRRWSRPFLQHAVAPVAQLDLAAIGLEMNVAGAELHAHLQKLVDVAHGAAVERQVTQMVEIVSRLELGVRLVGGEIVGLLEPEQDVAQIVQQERALGMAPPQQIDQPFVLVIAEHEVRSLVDPDRQHRAVVEELRR
jgi:hypothetical protein